jgi:alkaline phosphatase
MSKLLLSLILLLTVTACNPRQQNSVVVHGPAAHDLSSFKPAKNVVLLIGDGMGIVQISAALFSNDNYLFLEEFPVTGLQKPYSADNLITDSAAGATAMACGVKTYNGAIGVNEDSLPEQSLIEEAEAKGLATGVITTSTIVHATPAAFLAHQPNRKMFYEIALDICQSGADLLIGGGKKYFEQRADFDGRNLSKELSAKNYFVSDYFQTNFAELSLPTKKNLLYFTANDDPVPYSK